MQTEGRYYSDIEELEIVLTAEEANERLARGYELLKIETLSSMQKLGDLTAQETRRLVFVLRRRKKEMKLLALPMLVRLMLLLLLLPALSQKSRFLSLSAGKN